VESGISLLAGEVTLEYEFLPCYDRRADEKVSDASCA